MVTEEQKVFAMRDDEMERLDDLHTLCLMMGNNRLHWAPLASPKRALDLGCGTGKWMQEFSVEHPETQITGLDLEPGLSTPNIQTLTGDLERPWPVHPGFDYIHTRWLTGCIFDWRSFFKQGFNNLCSGGYFEILDICFPFKTDTDTPLNSDSELEKWTSQIINAGQISGRSMTIGHDFASLLEEVGFVDVVVQEKRLPMNAWSEDLTERKMGEIALGIHKEGYERLGHDYFVPYLGMSPEDVDGGLPALWREMEDRANRVWWPIYIVYGQKP